ncbi:MAG: hypothetical protein ACYC2R_09240 [Burkholderiales bacterium]
MKFHEFIAAERAAFTWKKFVMSFVTILLVPGMVMATSFFMFKMQQQDTDKRLRALNRDVSTLLFENLRLADEIRWNKYMASLKPGEQPRFTLYGIEHLPLPPLPAPAKAKIRAGGKK